MPMRVIVAEDDPTTSAFLGKWLESRGYEPELCAEGRAALGAYKMRAAQVVLTDWMMPEFSGLDLCRAIRALDRPKYSYLIILTAKSSHRDLIEALEAGADDFMSKPVQLDELSARLKVAERICGLQNQLRQLETLLPTCMYCKKIRDEQEAWVPIEQYISARTGSDFSHGVCPECRDRVMADFRRRRSES